MTDNKRDYWRPDKLRNAARLLQDASDNLVVCYPYTKAGPDPETLPAVMAMIAAAIECIKAAQPETSQ